LNFKLKNILDVSNCSEIDMINMIFDFPGSNELSDWSDAVLDITKIPHFFPKFVKNGE